MPRLTKIRIVGCRYDNFRKRHENSIYDLTGGEEPKHTLFTLNNQGGKGVLMQLISQIVLPDTRWGKQSGNKITSMFYDQSNRLRPYTFHVILEWLLDTKPEKWLITGICVTAFMRAESKEDGLDKEEEKQAGLNYFLYTHEHRGDTYFTLDSIPAYHKRDNKVADYKEFENFIDDNRNYFMKYSQAQGKRLDSDYYTYLKSKGIVKPEWEILKMINKAEGGVGNYFSKAADNRSIFDKFIIPAISENMKNYIEDDQDSLKEMFKSNLSITKNLPVLLKREGDFRELIYYIDPLIEHSEVGIRRNEMLERCILDGNNIYATLNNIYMDINRDIEVWINEKTKSLDKQKELNYERDSIPYARAIKEEVQLKNSLEEKLNEKDNIMAIIDGLKLNKKQYEISQLLIEKLGLEDKEVKYIKEKEILLESLKSEETEKEIHTLDENIKAEWEKTYKAWENTRQKHYGYSSHLESNRDNLERLKEKENKDIAEKRLNIKLFERKEKDLNKVKDELADIFDPFRIAMPQILLAELKEQNNQDIKDLEDLNIKITDLEKEREGFISLQTENKVRIDIFEKELKKLENSLKVKEKEEANLKSRVCGELNLDIHNEVYRESWLQNQSYQLSKLLLEKQELIEEQKLSLWENNIDKSLNIHDYWVPNKDILAIEERIKALGITVQLGSKYITFLEDKERDEVIKKFPSLTYGLIIANEKDWQIIKDNLTEELFLKSLIPVFIRSKMGDSSNDGFKVLYGKEIKLVTNPEKYGEWLKDIEKKDRDISGNIKVLMDKVSVLEKLLRDIDIELKDEGSGTIREKITKKQEDLEQLKAEKSRLIHEHELIISNKRNLKNTKTSLQDKIIETEKYIIRLIDFIDKSDEIEKERANIEALTEDIKAAAERIRSFDNELRDTEDFLRADNLNYEKWKLGLGEILKDIRIVIREAGFPDKEVLDIDKGNVAPQYKTIDDNFKEYLTQRKTLALNIEGKNNEIALINKDIEYIKKDIERLEGSLAQIDINWKGYKIINESEDFHRISINNIKKDIRENENLKYKVHDRTIEINATLESLNREKRKLERSIDEIYAKAPMTWEDIDIDEKEHKIAQGIKDNDKYLKEAEGILESLDGKTKNLDQVRYRIEHYRQLDGSKGKIDENIAEKLKLNPHQELEIWINRYNKIQDGLTEIYNETAKNAEEFNNIVKSKVFDEILKSKILQHTGNIKIDRYKSNYESFVSMKEHFQKEINSIASDKAKAEEVREQWAQRAARHSIRIIESLKEMIAGMNFVNENNYVFPLVSLKGEEYLPKEEDEIFYSLKEYFVESISKLLRENEDIDSIEDKTIDKLMGDEAIFARSLGGRYPKLMVYKMTEKNEFRYAKPKDYYYSSWEAINKGEGDSPEGSGGQTLSVNTFVIMMLMNYRKRYIGNSRPWTVLLLDNPFGKASGKHVLDPIFEIADKLNFQLIAFAAPEIIKAEISQRFPVFWALEIADSQSKIPGIVSGELVHGGRVNR